AAGDAGYGLAAQPSSRAIQRREKTFSPLHSRREDPLPPGKCTGVYLKAPLVRFIAIGPSVQREALRQWKGTSQGALDRLAQDGASKRCANGTPGQRAQRLERVPDPSG